ncbi:hypothetical protein ABC766_23555 [Methylobacterium fujisawaense]
MSADQADFPVAAMARVLGVSKGFSTLECELLARPRFRAQAEARMAVFSSIEGFCNPLRRHSALGDRSPVVDVQKTGSEPTIATLLSQAP